MTFCPTIMTAALAASLLAAGADEEGFIGLVRGNDLGAFELVGIGPDTITLEDGVIRLTGRPNGYFATKDSNHNYIAKFEWSYERPEGLKSDSEFKGNSGFLVHINGPNKVWPQCVEVQLMYGDEGNIFAIFGSKFQGRKDADAQKQAVRPVGQWNEMEVTCRDGAITSTINGKEVCRGTGASPDSGRIAWQSEGVPIRFRNLRIKPLD